MILFTLHLSGMPIVIYLPSMILFTFHLSGADTQLKSRRACYQLKNWITYSPNFFREFSLSYQNHQQKLAHGLLRLISSPSTFFPLNNEGLHFRIANLLHDHPTSARSSVNTLIDWFTNSNICEIVLGCTMLGTYSPKFMQVFIATLTVGWFICKYGWLSFWNSFTSLQNQILIKLMTLNVNSFRALLLLKLIYLKT